MKIDLIKYKEMVAGGLWELGKNDKGYFIKAKQFDVNTGKEIDPILNYLDVNALNVLFEQSKASAVNLGDLLADVKNLS